MFTNDHRYIQFFPIDKIKVNMNIYIEKYRNNKISDKKLNISDVISSDKKCLNCGSKNHIRKGDSIYCECGYLIEIIF